MDGGMQQVAFQIAQEAFTKHYQQGAAGIGVWKDIATCAARFVHPPPAARPCRYSWAKPCWAADYAVQTMQCHGAWAVGLGLVSAGVANRCAE